jgi:hypothetical protein
MSSDMRPIGAILAVWVLVAALFVSPVWGRAHHSHHYRRAVIEKVSVEENGALRELVGNDISPSQPGTRYVVIVSNGVAKYSGEFRVESSNDYPITLRPGQTVRFQTSQQQMLACDVNTMMTLITVNYLVLRDPQGKDWYLFMSSNLPPNFNASPFDGASEH